MRKIRMLLLALVMALSIVPVSPAVAAADDGYLYWGEVHTGIYAELHPYTLNWTGDVLDKGGMKLSDLQITSSSSEADIVMNQYGAIGAGGLVKLNQTLEERTSSRQQGFVGSLTMQAGDVYLVVLHDGSYAKLRIDRILPTKVYFSYVLEGSEPAPEVTPSTQPTPKATTSAAPTVKPSVQPSAKPSSQPSAKPTATPAPKPTPKPTAAPKEVSVSLRIDSPHAVINGKEFNLEKAPFIVNGGTTLVPVRFVTEAIGARVGWDGDEKKVTLRHMDKLVELWIDQMYARVNGVQVELEAAPTLLDGVTLVPVRFVVESFDQQIGYDPETRTITLTGLYDVEGQSEGDSGAQPSAAPSAKPSAKPDSGTVSGEFPDLAYGIWELHIDPQYQWMEETGPSAILVIDRDRTFSIQEKYTAEKKGSWTLVELEEVMDVPGNPEGIMLSRATSTADWALVQRDDGTIGLYYSYVISPGGLYGGRKIGWKETHYILTKGSDDVEDVNDYDLSGLDYSGFVGDWKLRVEGGATFYYYRDTGSYAGHEFTPSVSAGSMSVRADGTYDMNAGEKATGKWRKAKYGEVNGNALSIILQNGPGGIDWAFTVNASGVKAVLYDSGGKWTDGSVMWVIYYVADPAK